MLFVFVFVLMIMLGCRRRSLGIRIGFVCFFFFFCCVFIVFIVFIVLINNYFDRRKLPGRIVI